MAEYKYKLSFVVKDDDIYAGNVSGTTLITVTTGTSAVAREKITGETENYFQITGKTGSNTVWITMTNIPGSVWACVAVCRPLSSYSIVGPLGITAGTVTNDFGEITLTTDRNGSYVRKDYVNAIDSVHELTPYVLYRNIRNPAWNLGTADKRYQKGYDLNSSNRLVAYDKNGNTMSTGAYAKEYVCSKGLHFKPTLPTVWKIYDTEPENEPTPKTLRFSNNMTGITIVNNTNTTRTVDLLVTVGGTTDVAFEFSGTVPVGTNVYPVTFTNRYWNSPGTLYCTLNVSGSSSRKMQLFGTENGSPITFENNYGGEGQHIADFDNRVSGEAVINSGTLTLYSQSK